MAQEVKPIVKPNREESKTQDEYINADKENRKVDIGDDKVSDSNEEAYPTNSPG